MEILPPKGLFSDDEVLRPENDEPQWTKALRGRMSAQTGGIKNSIAEQTWRLISVETTIRDHQKDTDKKLGNLERKVDESDTKRRGACSHDDEHDQEQRAEFQNKVDVAQR